MEIKYFSLIFLSKKIQVQYQRCINNVETEVQKKMIDILKYKEQVNESLMAIDDIFEKTKPVSETS